MADCNLNISRWITAFVTQKWPLLSRTRPAVREVRLHELDGLRGWAALVVVLYHLFWEMFGQIVPEFRNPVFGFFLDGELAVAIFFVLSGEALSSAYFSGRGYTAVINLAVKRYPRLAIPILASCLIVLFLSHQGLIYNAAAAKFVERPDWLGTPLGFPLSLSATLHYSLFYVFADKPIDAINPYLWTMRIELVGSGLVFATLLVWRYLPYPRLCLILIFAAFIAVPFRTPRFLSCFIVGMIFADVRIHGGFKLLQDHRYLLPSWLAIVLVGLTDGVLHWYNHGGFYKAFFAIVLVAAIFSNRLTCQFFSSRLSRFLGDISFPLYLIQFPVFMSVTSLAIIHLSSHEMLGRWQIWIVICSSVGICIGGAVLFRPVELFTRWFGNLLYAPVDILVRRRITL